MDLKTKTGALYIRVSTDKQEELSPDAQIRLGLEYAQKHNIFVPDEYIFRDDGISGRQAKKRPAFIELIGLAKSQDHPIDTIIVWKFSRFTRNQEESIVYKSMLAKCNVSVLSISEPIIDGPFGSLIERIIEWMDEYYSINLATEVIRGMTQNAMKGNYQSEAPIGYTSKGDRTPPVINPDTIKIPQYCEKRILERATPRRIAIEMNEMGWQSKRGNKFDGRAVTYILQNCFYAGKNRWNYTGRGRALKPDDEVIYSDGNWIPIWTWDRYIEIQKALEEVLAPLRKGKRVRDTSAVKHWLTGVLVCSDCGGTLTVNKAAQSFQCWKYSKGLCSVSHSIKADAAVNTIIDGLSNAIRSDNLTYTIKKKSSTTGRESVIELSLSKLKKKEDRAKEAYLDGAYTLDEFKEFKKAAEASRKELEKELRSLTKPIPQKKTDKMMIKNVQDVIEVLKDPNVDSEKKGNAIRSIVEKIVFDRKSGTMDIILKLVI